MSAIIEHLSKLSKRFVVKDEYNMGTLQDVFNRVGGVRKDGVTLLGVAEDQTIYSISGQLEYKGWDEPDTRKPFLEKYGLSKMSGYIIKIDRFNPKLIGAENLNNELEMLEKILTENGYAVKEEKNALTFRVKNNKYGTVLHIVKLDESMHEKELIEITAGAIIFDDDEKEAIKIIDHIIEYYKIIK